jgi:hypothetical protein
MPLPVLDAEGYRGGPGPADQQSDAQPAPARRRAVRTRLLAAGLGLVLAGAGTGLGVATVGHSILADENLVNPAPAQPAARQAPAPVDPAGVAASDAPSTSPTSVPADTAGAGVPATVLPSAYADDLDLLTAPNNERTAGALRWSVRTGSRLLPGTRVFLVCSTFGTSDSSVSTAAVPWYATSGGWASSVAVRPDGAVPGCAGSLAQPVSSAQPLTRGNGPYPLITEGGPINLRSTPSTSGATAGQLRTGDFVTLSCRTTGDSVPGPHDRLGQATGSTAVWNRVAGTEPLYVSDAFVSSAAPFAVAPIC